VGRKFQLGQPEHHVGTPSNLGFDVLAHTASKTATAAVLWQAEAVTHSSLVIQGSPQALCSPKRCFFEYSLNVFGSNSSPSYLLLDAVSQYLSNALWKLCCSALHAEPQMQKQSVLFSRSWAALACRRIHPIWIRGWPHFDMLLRWSCGFHSHEHTTFGRNNTQWSL